MLNTSPHYSYDHEPVLLRQSLEVYLKAQLIKNVHVLNALPHYSHDYESLQCQ